MKKQILLRSAIGFPVGVCVCNLILLIIAFSSAPTLRAAPPAPPCFGSERTGVAVQFLLSGLVGAVYAGSSVIWEVETWSLFRATATHFCITTPLFWGLLCCWVGAV